LSFNGNCNDGGIFNISTGIKRSLIQILDVFQEVIEVPFEIQYFDNRAFDVEKVYLDNSKLLNCGEIKSTPFQEGILLTWEHLKSRS
jgi:UDP-glucose 4-epimerase